MDNKDEEYNKLFMNLYDEKKGIPDLIYEDFYYKKKKLYIKNKNFLNNKGFVIFYAAWCSHCKKITNLMYKFKNEYMNILNIGAVNIENVKNKNDIIAFNAGVSTLPHLMYINDDNSLTKYNFSITEENIFYFLNMNYLH
jgi:thiol-disulfide isomerase/thioredoxin